MLQMPATVKASYWAARNFYATQADEFHTAAYEGKKKELRAGLYSPYFGWDIRPAAMYYADMETAKLQERQWDKLYASFEGYEI